MWNVIAIPSVREAGPALDVASLHAAHADFVWASLHRLGVREADLPDLLQEVFLVVHRRLHTYDRSTKATTWLFGICLRVAAGHRRKAHHRRELSVAEVPEEGALGDAEEGLMRRDAALALERILDAMELEKRAVFVMFEIEGMPCDAIAAMLEIPVGTVYSRLHQARKTFETGLARERAAEKHRRRP